MSLLVVSALAFVALAALLAWSLAAMAKDADRRAELINELEARGYTVTQDDEP